LSLFEKNIDNNFQQTLGRIFQMDILKLAQLPEGQTLEFKRDTSALDAILKAVIAFSNSAGGIILIGVDDDGAIVGLADPAKAQEQVANVIAHRIKPQLLPEFSIVEVQHKSVLYSGRKI
jgi:ATP-dependent DNA helicase RecG